MVFKVTCGLFTVTFTVSVVVIVHVLPFERTVSVT